MSRIYIVNEQKPSGDVKQRLVEANTPAQARNHVAKQILTVKVADGKEIAKLMGAGTKCEDATAEPTTAEVSE
jgi:hypothetical protein